MVKLFDYLEIRYFLIHFLHFPFYSLAGLIVLPLYSGLPRADQVIDFYHVQEKGEQLKFKSEVRRKTDEFDFYHMIESWKCMFNIF